MEESSDDFLNLYQDDEDISLKSLTSNIDTVYCIFPHVLQKKIIDLIWDDKSISFREKIRFSLVSWTWFNHVSYLASISTIRRDTPSAFLKQYESHLTNRFCLIKSYKKFASVLSLKRTTDIFCGIDFTKDINSYQLQHIYSSLQSITIYLFSKEITIDTLAKSCENFIKVVLNNNYYIQQKTTFSLKKLSLIVEDNQDMTSINSTLSCLLDKLGPVLSGLETLKLAIRKELVNIEYSQKQFESTELVNFIKKSLNLQRIQLLCTFSESSQIEIIDNLPPKIKQLSMLNISGKALQLLDKMKNKYTQLSELDFRSFDDHNAMYFKLIKM